MINLMIPENVRQAYGSNALKNAFPTRWILRFCMWEKWPGVGFWQQFCAAAGAPYSDIWEPASPRSKKHVRRQQHENSESTKNKGRQVSISHFEPGSILRDHAAELQKSWYSKKTLMANNDFWFFWGGRRHEPPKWSLARSMNCYRKHHHNDSKTSKIWYNNKNLHFEYFLNFSWETAAGAFKLGPGLKHGLATQENTIKCVRNKSLSWVACKKSGTKIVISGHWPRLVDWTKTNLVHANFLDVYFPRFWVSPRLD